MLFQTMRRSTKPFFKAVHTTDKLCGPGSDHILRMSSNSRQYEVRKVNKITASFYASFIGSLFAHLGDMVPFGDNDEIHPQFAV